MVQTPINSVLVPESGKRLHSISSETRDVNEHVPEAISELASQEMKKKVSQHHQEHHIEATSLEIFNSIGVESRNFHHYDLDVSMPLFKATPVSNVGNRWIQFNAEGAVDR